MSIVRHLYRYGNLASLEFQGLGPIASCPSEMAIEHVVHYDKVFQDNQRFAESQHVPKRWWQQFVAHTDKSVDLGFFGLTLSW